MMWRQRKCMHKVNTHTHKHMHAGSRAHHKLALLLTHDQSKTRAHTGANHADSTDWSRSPAASSFYCPLNWNYTHTHIHTHYQQLGLCGKNSNYASKVCQWNATLLYIMCNSSQKIYFEAASGAYVKFNYFKCAAQKLHVQTKTW